MSEEEKVEAKKIGLTWSTGSFKRSLNNGPTVHLIQVPNPKVDKMPPSRISDLRLTSDESGSKLVALWTAPGDDYDNGNVSKYNFILSEYITDLLDASNDPPILQELIRSDLAGTKANFSFTFTKNYDTDYHIAMYAVDDSGNKANVSNIVLIRLPKPESTTKDPSTTPNPGDNGNTDWVMVGVVSGVVLTALVS